MGPPARFRAPHQSFISEQLGQGWGQRPPPPPSLPPPPKVHCHPGLPGQLWAGSAPGPRPTVDMGVSGWIVLSRFPLGGASRLAVPVADRFHPTGAHGPSPTQCSLVRSESRLRGHTSSLSEQCPSPHWPVSLYSQFLKGKLLAQTAFLRSAVFLQQSRQYPLLHRAAAR